MRVSVNNESTFELSLDFLEECVQLVDYVLLQEQAPLRGMLALTFVDEEEMATLNLEYRGKQGPTDVLSFPCDGLSASDALAEASKKIGDDDPNALYWAEFADAEDVAPILLGDVVIAPAVACAQSGDTIEKYEAEIRLLLAHGVLHLMGYDHEDCEIEAKAMEAREQELLRDWTELWAGEPSKNKCGGGCCG